MSKTEKYCPKCDSYNHKKKAKYCDICGGELIVKKARVKIPKGVKNKVFKRDGFRCQMCGASNKDEGVKLTVDHIIPLDKGGKDEFDNYQTLCKECNENKANLILPTGLKNDIEIEINALNSLNKTLEKYQIKLENTTTEDEKEDCLYYIKKIEEEDIPAVESRLKKLTKKFKQEQDKLILEREEKRRKDRLLKRLYIHLDDSTLNFLKSHFHINKNSKKEILTVLVNEHDETEINNIIFEKFDKDLDQKQKYLVCFRFDNSKRKFTNYLIENGFSRVKLINELNSSRNELLIEFHRILNYRQKILLKKHFSLEDCTDDELINYLIDSCYTEPKILKIIDATEQGIFTELNLKLTETHINLIKKHYSIDNYSKKETIEYLLERNIFSFAEVIEIIGDALIKEIDLDYKEISLIKHKYSHLKTDDQLYSFLVFRGYTSSDIPNLIESIKKELCIELDNKLNDNDINELSRMLNVPNSKDNVITYLIDNYTVEGLYKVINLLN